MPTPDEHPATSKQTSKPKTENHNKNSMPNIDPSETYRPSTNANQSVPSSNNAQASSKQEPSVTACTANGLELTIEDVQLSAKNLNISAENLDLKISKLRLNVSLQPIFFHNISDQKK